MTEERAREDEEEEQEEREEEEETGVIMEVVGSLGRQDSCGGMEFAGERTSERRHLLSLRK